MREVGVILGALRQEVENGRELLHPDDVQREAARLRLEVERVRKSERGPCRAAVRRAVDRRSVIWVRRGDKAVVGVEKPDAVLALARCYASRRQLVPGRPRIGRVPDGIGRLPTLSGW